jgi:hypothetical protein
MGLEHDSIPLFDWKMVKPFVLGKDFISEISLSGDQMDCTPIVENPKF